MAVTRAGIPVRVWSWPGNTTDTALIRQVKADLRDWTLGKVVWVADRGFTSTANRRALAAGAGGYILGEKLRSGSAEATAALSRPGRYATVAGQPAGQGSPHQRARAVRRLPQPRHRRPGRRHPRRHDRQAARAHRRLRRPQRAQAGRAAGGDLHQARPEPVPARHPQRAAPHRRRRRHRRGEAGRQVPAAHLRPAPVRGGRGAGLQAARRHRERLARHEARHRPTPRLSTASRTASAPTSCSAGSPCSSSASSRPAPGRRGTSCAPPCNACTSVPSPDPPAPTSRPPPPAPRPRPPSRAWAFSCPRRCSASTPPPAPPRTPRRRPDQAQHPALVTRRVTGQTRIPAGQPVIPCHQPTPQLRNAGPTQHRGAARHQGGKRIPIDRGNLVGRDRGQGLTREQVASGIDPGAHSSGASPRTP